MNLAISFLLTTQNCQVSEQNLLYRELKKNPNEFITYPKKQNEFTDQNSMELGHTHAINNMMGRALARQNMLF